MDEVTNNNLTTNAGYVGQALLFCLQLGAQGLTM